MTGEFPTLDLRQNSIPHKVVLYVGSLLSEEYSTMVRLDAFYMTHRSWLDSTSPRDIGSNLNLHIQNVLFNRGFEPHALSCLSNCFNPQKHDVSMDLIPHWLIEYRNIEIVFGNWKEYRQQTQKIFQSHSRWAHPNLRNKIRLEVSNEFDLRFLQDNSPSDQLRDLHEDLFILHYFFEKF